MWFADLFMMMPLFVVHQGFMRVDFLQPSVMRRVKVFSISCQAGVV